MPTTAEQLGRVQAFFGLSKSLLAKACRVQRQTIYDWYAGNFEAEGENEERLQRLWRLTERLSSKGLKSVPSTMVQRKRHDGSTLAALLSTGQLDEPAVERLCDQLGAASAAGRHITTIFLMLEPQDDELDDRADYHVALLWFACRRDVLDSDEGIEANQFASAFSRALESCPGIVVDDWEVRSHDDITLADLELIKRFDMDFRSEAPKPGGSAPRGGL